MWIIASIISSCYAYTWDIKMDWGLLEMKSDSTESRLLREETVYPSTVRIICIILEMFMNLMEKKNVFPLFSGFITLA